MSWWTSLIPAAVGALGSRSAANKQADATERAAELAYKQSMPWSTSGMFGQASFDEATRQATLSLDPTLQAPYNAWLARANRGAMRQAEMEGSPYEMGQKFYEAEQAVYAPGQQKERLKQENRLLAQGMLGSTGGAGQTQALMEAQKTQNLTRQAGAFDRAQSYYDNMRQREQGDINAAMDLGTLPLEYANLGRGIGGDLGASARQGAQARSGAAMTRATADRNMYRDIAGSFTDIYDNDRADQAAYDKWWNTDLTFR
jgi:hypothetical protein